MAIYHLRTSVGSRKGGQSASAKHDYIEREGRYSRDPSEVAHSESGNMPEWAADDPGAYWRAADAHERANGRLFREIEFALPLELDREQQVELAREFAAKLTSDERMPWSLAIHEGKAKEPGKPDNPHCHLILSERVNDGLQRPPERWFKRWNRKNPERGGARKTAATHSKDWLEDTRELWADLANAALEREGRKERIHEGTLEEQFFELAENVPYDETTPEMEALERLPGIHVGPAATALERRGVRTERGNLQRAVEEVNRRGADMQALQRWIDLTGRLIAQGRKLLQRAESRVRATGDALRQAKRGRTILDRQHRPQTYKALLNQLAQSVRLARRIRGGPARPPAGRTVRRSPVRTARPRERSRDRDSWPSR